MRLIKCKRCGKLRKHKAKGFCEDCYRFKRCVSFSIDGEHFKVYTNGFTTRFKQLITRAKNKVFEDCIKNPSKYLNQHNKKD